MEKDLKSYFLITKQLGMVLFWKHEVRNQKDQKTQCKKKNEAILDFVSGRLLHLTAYLGNNELPGHMFLQET